jgi:hypothetical protein
MPNWCSNSVSFSGEKENIDRLNAAIDKAIAQESKTNEGQKIHESDIKSGYFFEIYKDEYGIHYETKWCPNIEDVAMVCKQFKVSAEHYYSEEGMEIYGITKYNTDGIHETNDVPQDFLDEIEYNEDSDTYTFRGEEYENKDYIIEEFYFNI